MLFREETQKVFVVRRKREIARRRLVWVRRREGEKESGKEGQGREGIRTTRKEGGQANNKRVGRVESEASA